MAHSFVGEGNIEVLEGELGVDDDVEKAAAVCRGQPYPSAIGTEVGAIDGTGVVVEIDGTGKADGIAAGAGQVESDDITAGARTGVIYRFAQRDQVVTIVHQIQIGSHHGGWSFLGFTHHGKQ